MKKIIALILLVALIFAVLPGMVAFSEKKETDPGAYLKKIGIVKGFPDGSLNENSYITQAEYLSLLSRALEKMKTVKRGNLVKQTNFFDKLVNKTYHAYLILRYKALGCYYRTYMYFHRRDDAAKNEWYFKDLVYLKINGFDIPVDFKPNTIISEGYATKWAMEAFGLGKANEYMVESPDVNDKVSFFVLSVEHNMALDGISTAKPLKRGDAFKLVLKIIGK